MGIVITPYTEEHVEAVKAFNVRLRAGGASLVFPESHIPSWLPRLDGRTIYDEYYLALDDSVVRGAYILKYQPFFVGGELMPLVQYRLPLSEGYIDKQFAPVGVQMYLDAVRKQPNLYTVGLGGYDEPVAQLLIKAGWQTSLVPFYFRVLNPAAFLHNIVYLRSSPLRRIALDAMAASGLGYLAVMHTRLSRRATTRAIDRASNSAKSRHLVPGQMTCGRPPTPIARWWRCATRQSSTFSIRSTNLAGCGSK